jgi:hypothetical protein
MHKNNLRLLSGQDFTHAKKDLGRDVAQALTRRHDVEIDIGSLFESREDLVEHATMLTSDTDDLVQTGAASDFPNNRHHFYGFRPGPKNRHNTELHETKYLNMREF